MRMKLIAPAALCGIAIIVAIPLVVRSDRGDAVTASASNIGQTVKTFTLKSTTGEAVGLGSASQAKVAVVLFMGTECPINNSYLPRLKELHQEYSSKGVHFLAVNSNSQDTPERVAAHAKKSEIPFPVLKDDGAAVADLFAAQRTPEAFVLDASRTIRYRGRIDDQFGIGFKRAKPGRNDLKEALDEVLAGKAVSVPTTPVAGCVIARAVKPKSEASVTYAKHVAPILQHRCQECHRPNQIGPMSLLTYDDASSWSASIREAVSENRMPPWHADPHFGKFGNERRLSKQEKDTLLAWIDQGCPKGDDRDLPPPKHFVEGWRIGKPDAVFTMAEEFDVPAKMPRGGVRYQYFTVPTNFKEDMWVTAAEAVPGARAVVHHIIVFVMEPGKGRERHADGIGNGFLTAYAPGDTPFNSAPGTAKRLPKGATLVFQMHYTPNGTAMKDRSSVGLIFAKEPPKEVTRTRAIATNRFAIPPGDANHEVKSATTFDKEVLLITLFPHMHLRGKDFRYDVVYPDGKRETLLSVPRYDFGWQTMYQLEKPLRLPAGTRIECTAHFDNSPGNANNPDPTQTVRWGDQTWEEMMIGFVDYATTPSASGASE
jgi:peroxiredoxin